jgi:hypothetical protein
MGEVNAKILFDGPGPLDKKLVAFQSIEEALTFIPINHRALGQIINIIENNKTVRYCFESNINELVKIKEGGVGAVIQVNFPDPTNLEGGFVWINPDTLIKYSLYDNGTQKVWVELGPVSVVVGSETTGGIPEPTGSSSFLRSVGQWVEGVTLAAFESFVEWVVDELDELRGKFFPPYESITITSGATTWDCTTGLNKRVIAGGNFTLNITNLSNGMSGALTIDVLAATVVTLNTGETNKGNGSLTLTEGNYILAFTFDDNIFFWNIAKYV